jgi:hypothetical protein
MSAQKLNFRVEGTSFLPIVERRSAASCSESPLGVVFNSANISGRGQVHSRINRCSSGWVVLA